MNTIGWLQILIYLVVLVLLTKPLGIYISNVYNGEKTFADFIISPFEHLIYKLTGVDRAKEMNWHEYAAAILFFSTASFFAVYLILRLQTFLPLNPQEFSAVSPDLAFNTAISFASNTNWQSYAGETTMSYFSQAVALTVQNFVSAAVGMAVAVAFIRGISRRETEKLGNFWVDLVRGLLYILLPLALVCALFFVSQGVVQNFNSYTTAQTTSKARLRLSRKVRRLRSWRSNRSARTAADFLTPIRLIRLKIRHRFQISCRCF